MLASAGYPLPEEASIKDWGLPPGHLPQAFALRVFGAWPKVHNQYWREANFGIQAKVRAQICRP